VLSSGSDLTLLSTGICTEEALRAIHVLRERGVSIQHLHLSTLKPFDDPTVLESLAQARYGIVTMENHSILGGLGTVVAETMAEHAIGRRLVRIGLKDTFIHGASRSYLLREYGLDALALVREVEQLLGTSLSIAPSDLASVRIEAAHSEAKAEAL
jgi:transketolase